MTDRPVPAAGRRLAAAYLVALLAPVALGLALYPLRTTQLRSVVAILFVLPVLGATVVGGRRPGLVAAAVSVVAFDVFLTVPYLSLRIAAAGDVVVAAVLFVTAVVTSQLTGRWFAASRDSADRRQELDSLRRFAMVGSGAENASWLIDAAASELGSLLGASQVDYRPGAAPPTSVQLSHGRIIVPGGRVVDLTSPECRVAVPVDWSGQHLGHFLLSGWSTSIVRTPAAQRSRAVAVADLLAGSLRRSNTPSSN